jgi:hypothetical protein
MGAAVVVVPARWVEPLPGTPQAQAALERQAASVAAASHGREGAVVVPTFHPERVERVARAAALLEVPPAETVRRAAQTRAAAVAETTPETVAAPAW